jgi:hypothetical protein
MFSEPMMIVSRSGTMKRLETIAGNARIRVLTRAQVRAERYRAHAAECAAFAQQALSADDKATLANMAAVWRRLAELVERLDLS